LDEILTNVLRVFSPCYSQSPPQLCLEISISCATSYSFYSALLCTVKEKGGKPDRNSHPLSYGLRNPYGNLKSENSQDYALKSQRNCTFMNSASGHLILYYIADDYGCTLLKLTSGKPTKIKLFEHF
jgi:hypothetical protein